MNGTYNSSELVKKTRGERQRTHFNQEHENQHCSLISEINNQRNSPPNFQNPKLNMNRPQSPLQINIWNERKKGGGRTQKNKSKTTDIRDFQK